MTVPALDIIIVNWNSGPQLRQCLESLIRSPQNGFALNRVVVVDNASRDGSANGLGGLSLPLTVIRNTSNRGFAAACNQGAQNSNADYLLFLNPDTRLEPDSLSRPVSFMETESSREIGICGIQLINDAGTISPTCSRFPTVARLFAMMVGLQHVMPRWFPRQQMVDWDHRESRVVDQVMGAFFLIRGALFRQLGGFDERFFVYWEEVDLALRAQKAGFLSYYLSDVRAYHRGQGTIEGVFPVAFFYLLRSRCLYCYKHFGGFWATLLLIATLFLEPVSRSIETALRLSLNDAAQVLKAYGYLWRALPKLTEAKELS